MSYEFLPPYSLDYNSSWNITFNHEVLRINISHTRVMGWWGVGRLNKNFGGQVLFGSDFDLNGWYCYIVYHSTFDWVVDWGWKDPKYIFRKQYPHLVAKTSETQLSVLYCLILHFLLNTNGGESFYNGPGGTYLTTLSCVVLWDLPLLAL